VREALARTDAAETNAQVAEGRARAAEARIAREVEARMAAAASNRALWPVSVGHLHCAVAFILSKPWCRACVGQY
jgi:hypothetical protein